MLHLLVGVRSVGKTTLGDYLASRDNFSHTVRFSPRRSLPMRPADQILGTDEQVKFVMRNPPSWQRLTIIPNAHVDDTFEQSMRRVKDWYLEHERTLIQRGGLSIFVDEARFGGLTKSESFDYLVRCGDRAAVHVILAMHRPVDVHPDFRSVVDWWYVFNVTGPSDLDVLSDHCSDLPIGHVPRLRVREFYTYRMFGESIVDGKPRFEKWGHDRAHLWKPQGESAVFRSASPLLEASSARVVDELDFALEGEEP